MAPESKRVVSPYVEEACGGLSAGVIGTLIGYPLDVIKTQLQTTNRYSNTSTTTNNSKCSRSRSVFGTGAHIVRTEGWLALYRGVAPPLLSLSILNTFTFAAYSYTSHTFGAQRGTWDGRTLVAGASLGPAAAFVSTVENLVKTQLQTDRVVLSGSSSKGSSSSNGAAHHRRYSSSWDCFRQLVQQQSRPIPGVLLYTGHGINTAREVAFIGTYFFCYEGLRGALTTSSGPRNDNNTGHSSSAPPPSWAIPVAGGLSGAVAWTVSFPLDCVRAGVQGRSNLTEPRSAGTVLRELLATRGVMGLYAGVTPSIVRAFLVSGTRFSAYETTVWMLRQGSGSFRSGAHNDVPI